MIEPWTWTFQYPSTPGLTLRPGSVDGIVGRTIRLGQTEAVVTSVVVAADERSALITVQADAAPLASLTDQDFMLEN
jgi:hypothetical protein